MSVLDLADFESEIIRHRFHTKGLTPAQRVVYAQEMISTWQGFAVRELEQCGFLPEVDRFSDMVVRTCNDMIRHSVEIFRAECARAIRDDPSQDFSKADVLRILENVRKV